MFLQTPCPRRGIVALVAFDLSLLCVFCMLPQMAFIRGCLVTLVAFVWLFSAVHFQMIPQTPCLRRVILVAYVWLFSTVPFQMFLQTPCPRRGILALVALDLSLLCVFCMLPHGFFKRIHNRIGCICLTFLHCAFSYVVSNGFYKRMHSRIGCICLTYFSPLCICKLSFKLNYILLDTH